MAIQNQPNSHGYMAKDGKSGMYDRALTTYLKGRSPSNYSVVEAEEFTNSKYKYFQKVGMRRPEAIAKNSVTLSNPYNNSTFSQINQDKSFNDIMYASASEDKPGRLRDYRTMAAYSEVADALDEICDECLNADENGEIVTLSFKNVEGLDSDKKQELYEEWSKYSEHYDFHNFGWQYYRQLLIEGEVFFEQIIHDEYTNEGVLGIVNVPADLIDPVYSNVQNMMIKGFIYNKPIFDVHDPKKVERYEPIPFQENQIVYIGNGTYNETKEFIIPFIENCRRAYRQLSMMEDALVIHRLVHAPLRFVFNVDVGNLPVPQAEAYLRKIQSQYWSTKTFDQDQGDIVKKYSPQSTLDSYWFAKRQGQEPTTVQTIGGQPADDQMDSLHFFLKKLYRSLKVPTSRLDPEDAFRDGTDILREELKFAMMIIRHQKKFAAGIKKGFIVHLKLKHMFEQYDLTEQNIHIEFNPPTNFYDLRNNQKLELKIGSYNNLMSTQKVSDTYAKKKVLGWKDKDILADRELRRKDAELEWELQQILALGPNWKEQVLAQAKAAEAGAAGGAGGLPGGSGLPPAGDDGGMPPEFGGPAEIGGAETVPPPNAGVPPEAPIVPEEQPA